MISFIIIGILLIFLLKKNLSYHHSFVVISLNLFLIFYFYNYEFLGFEDDSKDYYNNTKLLFDNFTLIEIIFGSDQLDTEILKHPYFSGGLFAKIYLFFYLIFFIFGTEPYVLSIFYLFLKCVSFIYISNFLSKKFKYFENEKIFFSYLILLNPWGIYFQNFFFLKEGVIIFASIINIITFYKLFEKFKIIYVVYLLLSLLVIFYFRYYLTYLLIFFYFIYFVYFYFYLSTINKNIYPIIISISLLLIILSFFISFEDIINIIINNFNLLSPVKYILSPSFLNVAINEESNIRLILSLVDNFIIFTFFYSLIKYGYNNKLINYLIIFVLTFTVAQVFSPPEILTGGRHRGFIFWSIAVIIVLRLANDKKKKKNSLFL